MKIQRVHLGDALWCLCLTGIALLIRWPALGLEAFHNEDTAGIAYNADLLLRGGLPLVDNVEMKAPGSFYLSAMAWSIFGRSLTVLQGVICAWAIVGAIGIYVGGCLLYDRRAGLIASVLYTIAAPITDSIDINYGAWMMAPYIWSTVFFVRGQDRGPHWLAASGATLAIAGLLKRQAAVLFPLFAVLILAAPLLLRNDRWRIPERPWRHLFWFLGGLAVGFAPLMAYYAYRGHLGDFVSHYFFSEVGWQYVKGSLTWGERVVRIGDGFLGFWEYMALPTLLAVLSVAAGGFHRRWTARGVFLAGHFWLSFLGAALGLRFFKGYYLQVLPAAVWIAAHPDGVLHRWLLGHHWRGGRRVVGRNLAWLIVLLLAITPAFLGQKDQMSKIRKMRSSARDAKAQKVAKVIAEATQPGDPIWVWGRWAWPIYFHADRPAATDYPKTLGLFTTTLTNTWRRPTKNTEFDPRSNWKTLMSQLKRDRPKFIVLSHNEKYRAFAALNALIRAEYRATRGMRVRGFSVYQRKDLPQRKTRLSPKKAKGKAGRKTKSVVRPLRGVRPGQPAKKTAKGAAKGAVKPGLILAPGKTAPKVRQPSSSAGAGGVGTKPSPPN